MSTRTPLLDEDHHASSNLNDSSSQHDQQVVNNFEPPKFQKVKNKIDIPLEEFYKYDVIELFDKLPTQFVDYEDIYKKEDSSNYVMIDQQTPFFIKDNYLFVIEYSQLAFKTLLSEEEQQLPSNEKFEIIKTKIKNTNFKDSIISYSVDEIFEKLYEENKSDFQNFTYGNKNNYLKYVKSKQFQDLFYKVNEDYYQREDHSNYNCINVYYLPNLQLLHTFNLNLSFQICYTKLRVQDDYIYIYSSKGAFIFKFDPSTFAVLNEDPVLLKFNDEFFSYYRTKYNFEIINFRDYFIIKNENQITPKLITDELSYMRVFLNTVYFENFSFSFDYVTSKLYIFDYEAQNFINHRFTPDISSIKQMILKRTFLIAIYLSMMITSNNLTN
eukprot:403361612